MKDTFFETELTGHLSCDDHIASAGQEAEADHLDPENHERGVDLRFTDPVIAECVETWRMRQDMVRAQSKLTLQIKAICRRFVGGDLAEAGKLYAALEKGTPHPLADAAMFATLPLFEARKPLEEPRARFEKHMTKLGKQLPISHMADEIKGIGHLALAKIVAECGDLSEYKSVAAVWKRAGLAVIDGERQRKVAGDAALIHGYSPTRRSTFWNIADPMLKAQGKDENAGPYRLVYDDAKAKALAKDWTKARAHNHALRIMTKRLLLDLTVEWRRLSREAIRVATSAILPPSGSGALVEAEE